LRRRPITYKRTEVDGVPTYYASSQLPFTASLVFRVGRADEPLPSAGITHLVEHLAMPIDEAHGLDANATVEGSLTHFYASGPEETVAEYLEAVARSLADLPLERLDTERRILQTEAQGRVSPGVVGLALLLRYGARNHGLVGLPEYGLTRLSADDVASWASERFTRENAVLWLTGAPPKGLRLPLRDGRLIASPTPAPIDYLEPPCVYDRTLDQDVVLACTGRRSVALVDALIIAERRLRRRIRFEQGLSYSVDALYEPLTANEAHLVFTADSMEDSTTAVQDALLETLRELARHGPTPDELRREVELARRRLADTHDVGSSLYYAATTELFGTKPDSPAELIAEHESLTPEDVAHALEEALSTSLLIVPFETKGSVDGFRPYPTSSPRPVAGTQYRRRGLRLRRDPSQPQLIVGDEGIATIAGDDRGAVRFDECEAALRWPDGTRGLWSTDGFYVEVSPELWRHGREIVDVIDRGVPEELWVPMDPETEERAAAVEQVASERVKRSWLTSDELDALPGHLERGEQLVAVARASQGWSLGVLALTDRRLMFVYFADVKVEVPREAIAGAEATPGSWFSDPKLVVRTREGELTFTDLKAELLGEFERALRGD
jgi:zinc protease